MLGRLAAPLGSVLFVLVAACSNNPRETGTDAGQTIDSPSGPVCGDGICAPSETTTCPADCGTPIDAAVDAGPDAGSAGGTCNNNGTCEPNLGESNTSCPSDCTYVCGNGICETGEDASSCPADCGAPPFDCNGSASPTTCNACLTADVLNGPGYCDSNHEVSGGTANDCVACIGSGVFDASCASMCNSGYETEACAQCVAESFSCGNGVCEEALGETLDTCPADCTFSCTNATDAASCVTCLQEDWSDYETSPTGECATDSSIYPGNGSLCAACVGSGYTTYGSVCSPYCGSGETSDCVQCMAAQEFCGDGDCATYDGENPLFCPTDCTAVCGDGVCQTDEGETLDNCPADCSPDCHSARTALQCKSCFDEDTDYFGDCTYDVEAPLTPDGCAACVGSGGFGSDNPCEAECDSGETSSCAHCMHNLGASLFDCSNPYTLAACQICFSDDDSGGPGTCDTNFDAFPGSAADCMSCVLDGAFGSGCASVCSGGEDTTCFECIQYAEDCGDGTCETYDDETSFTCPQDCGAPPANDTCATATALTLDTATHGTTIGATDDYGTSSSCTGYTESGPDVVYSVTLTAGTAYTAQVVPSSFDTAVSIIGPGDATVCDASETACMAGADAGGYDGTETASFTPSTTGTYFIIVDGYGGESGPFTITVSD